MFRVCVSDFQCCQVSSEAANCLFVESRTILLRYIFDQVEEWIFVFVFLLCFCVGTKKRTALMLEHISSSSREDGTLPNTSLPELVRCVVYLCNKGEYALLFL